jgi:protein-export membrane protein SecD
MLHFTRWKTIAILAVVALGFLATLPNVLPQSVRERIPGFLPSSPLVLGLDLQGGSHVLLEVDRAELAEQLAKQLVGDIRQTLREQKIRYSGLGRSGDGVTVRITDDAQVEQAYTELRKLARPVTTGFFGQGGTASEFDVSRDGNQIVYTLTPAGLAAKTDRALQQSLEIVEHRVNALGTTEPSIQREGANRILIQVPGLQDSGRLKDLLGKTARLQFRLLCDSQPQTPGERAPAECEEMPEQKNAQQKYWVQTSSRATVEGEDLNDAQPAFDSQTNEPIVSFRFNQKGALRFGKLTQENVGRPFAIVLDNEVVSAPRINEPILGGAGQISGRFSQQEANDLAIVLRSGALPAKLTIVEERTVGPSLGRDSIRAGAIASVVATVFIGVFMIVCYGLLGIFAVVALIANNFLMIGVLSWLGATLTLPGIAGIVLTMGMAVDANVLIYERMREEAHSGRSAISAIEAGFSRALATIIDSHLTALIAAIALFALGSGPIRGFAVTLAIGIVSTLFTNFLVTRLIVATWVRQSRPKAVPL